MHTFCHSGVAFSHNGDFSGKTIITRQNSRGGFDEFEVPFEAMKALVAEYVRQKLRNDLDEMSAQEILLRGVK